MTWRQPEALRPSRGPSHGAAAFLITIFLLVMYPGSQAIGGWRTLLSPEAQPLCTGRRGFRAVTAVTPDGTGGVFILTADAVGETNVPLDDDVDIYLIHLNEWFERVPFPLLYLGDDPCGALITGGRGGQIAFGSVALIPGSFVMAGVDTGSDPWRDHRGVFFQGSDSSGERLFGPGVRRVGDPERVTDLPVIVGDGVGGFLIGWHEGLLDSSTFDRLVLLRFDGHGKALWPEPVIVSRTVGTISGADTVMVGDESGGAYIAWGERGEETTGGRHFYRVQGIDREGKPRWDDGGLILVIPDPPRSGVALFPDGDAGVVAAFAVKGIRAQKISASGQKLWGETGREISTGSYAGPVGSPFIAGTRDRHLYVTWKGERGGLTDLLVRRIELDGAIPWMSYATLTFDRAALFNRGHLVLDDGSLAVVWDEIRDMDGGRETDVYGQTIDPRGRLKGPPEGFPIIEAPGRQHLPVAFHAGTGSPPRLTVIWSDDRFETLEGPSTALLIQQVVLHSSPRLDPFEPVRLRQGEEVTLSLHGDDIYTLVRVETGVAVTGYPVSVVPDSEDGPGDTITLSLRADDAAPLGPRELTLVNSDGGAVTIDEAFVIELDPARVDIDRSGRIDGFDLALIARSFGLREGEGFYSPDADIDADGMVDGADLALLASRFGGAVVAGRLQRENQDPGRVDAALFELAGFIR